MCTSEEGFLRHLTPIARLFALVYLFRLHAGRHSTIIRCFYMLYLSFSGLPRSLLSEMLLPAPFYKIQAEEERCLVVDRQYRVQMHASLRVAGKIDSVSAGRQELMRIVLIGQAAFAEKVLHELHARGEDIVHVYSPPDSGGRPDPLTKKAQELGLPLSQPASFKGQAMYEHFKSLNADLAILAFVTLIVPERILYTPTFKSICFHPSILPRHRGASGINWAIIQGDSETGVTWFGPTRVSIPVPS